MIHGDMNFLQRGKYLGSGVWVSVPHLHASYQSVFVSISQPVIVTHISSSEACKVSKPSTAGAHTVPHHAQCLRPLPVDQLPL